MKIILCSGHGIAKNPDEYYQKLMQTACDLYNNGSDRLIFSGGFTNIEHPHTSEAASMRDYSAGRGWISADDEHVILEEKSKDSYQNLQFSREVIPQDIDADWYVVTYFYKQHRYSLLAEILQMPHTFIPVARSFTSQDMRDELHQVQQFRAHPDNNGDWHKIVRGFRDTSFL